MPKYNYSDVKIIKRKKSKFFKSIKLFSAMLLLAGVVYFFADVFSSMITTQAFSFSLFERSENIKYKTKPLYALMLGEYNTVEQANEVANVAGSWGAGGYVVNLNNKYYVVGSIYSTKEDCEKVKENLKLTNYNTLTMELSFKNVNFDISGITSENKQEVLNTFEFLEKLYSEVYNISIKVDKGEITNIAASSLLNTLKSEVKVMAMDLNKLNLSYSNKQLSSVFNCLTKMQESLDCCVNQMLTNSYINSSVKYCLCEIVFLSHNLLNNL